MLDTLLSMDTKLFLSINHLPLPDFIQTILVEVTNLNKSKFFMFVIFPLALSLAYYLLRKKALKAVFVGVLLAVVADQVNYRIFKQLFYRPRPYMVVAGSQIRLPHRPESSSFPSNHATSSMAVCSFLACLCTRKRKAFLFLSVPLLIGWTRIYVGVHYPSDVISGWILGASVGWLTGYYTCHWVLDQPIPANESVRPGLNL